MSLGKPLPPPWASAFPICTTKASSSHTTLSALSGPASCPCFYGPVPSDSTDTGEPLPGDFPAPPRLQKFPHPCTPLRMSYSTPRSPYQASGNSCSLMGPTFSLISQEKFSISASAFSCPEGSIFHPGTFRKKQRIPSLQ